MRPLGAEKKRAPMNPDASLSKFLEAAESLGTRIVREEGLSRDYEAAERMLAAEKKGHTLLFTTREYGYLFAANLLPSRAVLYRAIGAEDDAGAYRALARAEEKRGKLVHTNSFGERFRKIASGDEALSLLPALRFYADDGGRYITSSIFIACSGGICNASIHRIMVSDKGYAAVRVVPRHLYAMLQKSGDKGLPVAIVIGVDPRVLLAAALSPPLGVFELEIAASLLGGSLQVCTTPRYGLPVPCGASMVVEARLGPERAPEGPFTDLLGLYDRVREEPVLHVEDLYVAHRQPVMHTILPGGIEHMLLMGFPREAAIYNAVSKSVPRVAKVRLTPGGGMWLHAVIAIKKQHDGDGKTAAMAALGAHPSLKHVVVVDDDIDPDDPRSVEWAIATRLQADRGIVVVPYARGSTLDPSSRDGLTAKLIVDATAPISERAKYRRPRIPSKGERGG